MLARADEGDLEEYIRQSNGVVSKSQREAFLAVIFQRYAAIDPRRAIDRALELDHLKEVATYEILYSIFGEWVVADRDGLVAAIHELPQVAKEIGASAMMQRLDHLLPDELIELAKAIGPNDVWIEYQVDGIQMRAFKEDPRAAYFDLVRDASRNDERTSELSEIAKHWIQIEGVAVVREIYDSLESANERHNVLNNVIWRAVGDEVVTPPSMLLVVSEFPNKTEAGEAIEKVFRAWSHVDPKSSFEAALKYDDRFVSDSLRRALLFTWASKDADGLYEEALLFPPRIQRNAIALALKQISNDSPQDAIRLARKLDSDALRLSARNAIVEGWRTIDAKSAFEWLVNDELAMQEPNDKSPWRDTFFEYLNQNYEAARTYVDQYEGDLKDQFVEATFQHLLTSDLDLAIEYISNEDSKISKSTLSQFAFSFAEYDPIKALSFGESVQRDLKGVYYHNWGINIACGKLDEHTSIFTRLRLIFGGAAPEPPKYMMQYLPVW